jgi:DNA polymerase
MTAADATPDQRALESLLAFWAEAGVDATYAEAPIDRLAEGKARLTARPASPPPTAAAPRVARSPAQAAPDIAAALAEARAAAGAAATLDELAAAIAAFDGCGLKREGATQSVFARGDPKADLMIIGEGPGADEDRQGKPFVGRAGQLLDRMLAAAGLEGRVFITNTVFWRPPGNRTPSPMEQAVCAPFVERAIALVKPRMLMFAGGASAKAMLKTDEGILSLRGRWFEWRATSGDEGGDETAAVLPAMPTLHPAFLLRQPAAKKKAWGDLLTLIERLDRPERPH